jgi:predicted MFS family arabinose efflux permease
MWHLGFIKKESPTNTGNEAVIDEAVIKERLWNANYCKTMIGNFMLFFSFYILTPLLPIYLDAQFKADKDVMGLVLSGYVVAALLVRPFSGFLVDTFDRKRVLVLCFFAFFILFTGYIGAGTLLLFALVRTLHGLPFGAVTVANSTMAIDVVPSSRRNEGIGFYGLSNNLAMAFAPSVGIWIYNATDNFQLLFWIALITALVGFVTVSSIRHSPRTPKREKQKISLDRFFLTRGWLLAVNIICFSICWGIMSNYVAIYGAEVLNITDGTGLFFMILSFGLFASRIQGSKALAKGKIVENAALGVVFSLAGYSLFAAVEQSWAYYLSAALIGLGNGHMYPAFLTMFIKLARNDQRGTANSSILTAWDVGMGLGIIAGGYLLEYISYSAAFWGAAVMQATGTLLYFLFSRRFFLTRRLDK